MDLCNRVQTAGRAAPPSRWASCRLACDGILDSGFRPASGRQPLGGLARGGSPSGGGGGPGAGSLWEAALRSPSCPQGPGMDRQGSPDVRRLEPCGVDMGVAPASFCIHRAASLLPAFPPSWAGGSLGHLLNPLPESRALGVRGSCPQVLRLSRGSSRILRTRPLTLCLHVSPSPSLPS